MSPTRTSARLGRPKDTAKRAAITQAAMALFARQPYDTVTMEAVAAQASVSKMTVYSHFSDKETLFEMVVTSVSDRLLEAFAPAGQTDRPLRDLLCVTGVAFLSVILAPEVASMAQMLPTALRGNEALAMRFYNAGPGRVRGALTAVIAKAAASGLLQVDDPLWAAEDLISLWEGCLPAEMAFGLARPVTTDEIERRARRGTAIFLRAYAPLAIDGGGR